jgi:uncharacterized protein YndB with AHSA1/START domain
MGYSKEIEIEAQVERVWNAWLDKQETEKWLAPRANIRFEVGGEYEFFWNEDPGIDSTIGCKLLKIEQHKFLAFEWQGKKEFLYMFLPPRGMKTTIEVGFFPTGDRGTRVVVSQAETRDLPRWKDYDNWMAAAWQMAMESLKNHCEGKAHKPYWEE